MAFVGTEWHGSCPGTGPVEVFLHKCWLMTAVGIRLSYIIMYIFYVSPSSNVLPTNINIFIIVKDSRTLEVRGVAMSQLNGKC